MFNFPNLKNGDKIALACPSSRCLQPSDLLGAKAYLEQQGFEIVSGEECQAYLPAAKKAEIFLNYIFDEQIKMIWILRGGEGSADLLPFLERHKEELQKRPPKLLFGFSDFTVLLNYFAFQYQWPVVHGIGALQLVRNVVDVSSVALSLSLIRGQTNYRIDGLKPLNHSANSFPNIRAVCAGGNLSLLNLAIGDVWQFKAADKILIIEDVGEMAYQITRSLKYLQRIGFFQGVKAIIFGDFTVKPLGKTVAEQEKEADNIGRYLRYFAESVSFPVLCTDKIGHGAINYPVVLNYPATLTADGVLQFI